MAKKPYAGANKTHVTFYDQERAEIFLGTLKDRQVVFETYTTKVHNLAALIHIQTAKDDAAFQAAGKAMRRLPQVKEQAEKEKKHDEALARLGPNLRKFHGTYRNGAYHCGICQRRAAQLVRGDTNAGAAQE